ncbi:MAG: RNA-guided pseudouridylation complex pseudouridine synthase subunit Cbf5 [Promethearchaeota archaeon]
MRSKLPFDRPRNIIIKAEDEILWDYGKPPEKRTIYELLDSGIINLDKVAGPTSHEVISWVKKIFKDTNVVKTGHGGTLDPKVTGVLPSALNKAVRAVDMLLTAGKEYVGIMRVHGTVKESKLESVIRLFEGKIYQKPPVKAAVKRRLRVRQIYYIDLLEIDGNDVLFRVGCQAGTYIRKLCYDIGEVIGCGAQMTELRRTQSGPFKEDDTLVTLQDLVDAVYYWREDGEEDDLRRILQPMEKAFHHLPKIIIRDSAVDSICRGALLTAPGVLKLDDSIKKGNILAIFTQKGEIVSLGISLMSSKEILSASSGFVARSTRVYMKPGTYPKWVRKR